jgi:DNA mismatch repair ATPase MutS
VRGSELLDITLTSRKDGDIPMAGKKFTVPFLPVVDCKKYIQSTYNLGIPIHAVDNYVERLIKKGVSVAICDQLEPVKEARKRKGAGNTIIKREITRLYHFSAQLIFS